MVPAERPPKTIHALQKTTQTAILVGGQSLTFWVDYFKIPVPPSDTPYLTQDADVLATRHDAHIVAAELQGTLRIAKLEDHTSNTAIVTYKTPDGRTLFIDFMGTLIGLTNEEIRKLAVELEHPEYGFIRILHPTLVLKSRIVNLHRLSSKRDTNGIEQARLAVLVAKAFFKNYVASGFAGKKPDRYLIDRVVWLEKLALSDAGMFVFTQWGIDVMGAAPIEIITNKKFHTEHWPRVDARVQSKRDRKKTAT
ncbi:hypothetical protein [Candidatus Nitrotoga sp. AM1P]|uniref:hypothetical protein n=1 Tax=Candidatus Nitrotoga sp. AM1P TaxID=2559597 RepID=UPI0010B4D681|nr:hypothetical protein [Candidatus Nitrotoga sp. AM1P]BBJ22164.1 hypothetical protein W01_00910 [Candidatus Nitrotoga sp. AM1P]